MKMDMDDMELKHKAELLLQAEEIKADEELMAKLEPYLAKKHKAISSLAELRAVATAKIDEEAAAPPETDEEEAEEDDKKADKPKEINKKAKKEEA